MYNFFFHYFKGIGYKLFINKINYFLLCPFFSLLASLLDEVKIDLWDKIRTMLSGSTFTCHKLGNPPKPWLTITQLLIWSALIAACIRFLTVSCKNQFKMGRRKHCAKKKLYKVVLRILWDELSLNLCCSYFIPQHCMLKNTYLYYLMSLSHIQIEI